MLSILICSLANRQRQLNELMGILEPQIRNQPVEVLVEQDNGELKIGTKRNLLMSKATRKYVAYVDDDDIVDALYVPAILGAISKRGAGGQFVDCIGMCGYVMGEGGTLGWQFRHSITVGSWCKDRKRHIYFRTPNHLNPVLRTLASQIQFPEQNWGEDRAYSERLRLLLHTENFIEHPIYYYRQGNK